MKLATLCALLAAALCPRAALADHFNLIGPELGVMREEHPTAMVGVGIGVSDRGRSLELLGRTFHSRVLSLGMGGLRLGLDLFKMGASAERGRDPIFYFGLGVAAGGGVRGGRSLGLVSSVEPHLGFRVDLGILGLSSFAVSWIQPVTGAGGQRLRAGPVASVSWTPLDRR